MQDNYGLTMDRFAKGIYPYSYFNAWSEMEETCFPPITCFNDLTEQPCSEDYAEAQAVWRDTQCRTLRDYTRVYLKFDVMLLVDAFEAFRERIHRISQLEACRFCGIPGLTYAFCFKYCNLELSALTNPTMYTFFEEGIRGGMTLVNKHVSQHELPSAQNNDTYTHLCDIEANAWYSNAHSVKLPHSNFQ